MKNMMIMIMALVSFICCASEDPKKSGGDIKVPHVVKGEKRELIILPHGFYLHQRQLAEQQGKHRDKNPLRIEDEKIVKMRDYERCP